MGIRKSGSLPVMRHHKQSGRARVRVGGKTHWLGQHGSAEAQLRYDELIAAYLASGRTSVEAAVSREPEPADPPPATGQLTVGELSLAWIKDIEATLPNCRKTSLWHDARTAARAVRMFGTSPAATFGPQKLLAVRQGLIDRGHLCSRKPDTKTRKRLSRRYVNDIIARIQQMFRWGVLHELVPDDRPAALAVVPKLAPGQSKARETKKRKPVKKAVFRATLPFLTKEVADLLLFIRLTGCRPSEAARMRLVDIRDRQKKVWRYVPRRHKTSHRGKQRHIAIGPQAQAIILEHVEGRDPAERVFTPQRSVPARRPRDGVIAMTPRQPSSRVGSIFKKDAIARALRRAIEKMNRHREQEGLEPLPSWTAYQLRYLFLREARRIGGREGARAIAGHSQATMTDHYAPAGWRKAERVAARIG